MKSKLKNILISFILIITIEIILSPVIFFELGITFPHVGLLYVLGLLLGPYGALGATLGNLLLDIIAGYSPRIIIPSAIFTFGISYLAYKLWYSGFKAEKITKPQLDTVYHIFLFISSIIICGFIYSIVHGLLFGLFIDLDVIEDMLIIYFINFTNLAFIFGILGIWLSKKIDFITTPKKSKRSINQKVYRVLICLLIITTVLSLLSIIIDIDNNIIIGELTLIGILLFCYLTKPFEYEIESYDKNRIIEKIINNFLIITVTIAIIGLAISIFAYNYIINTNANFFIMSMPGFIITDIILAIFFIPSMIILKYIENKVITPISRFSEIKPFIKENEKIESEGLVNIYSNYINENNEIGTLAQSYTDLIEHNNKYIENINEIEGEKKRVEAELDIATKMQAASLPTKALETNEFTVNGYSHPAKEVGGDFFDYYMLDEDNLAIIIGDASGKGIPAALLTMITQVMVKQMLKHDNDPSKVLYSLNNQLSENNPQSMFLTLWLGIYNKSTKKLTFSNAGHNPPLIKENNEFRYLNIDPGLVLGLMDNYDYINEKITLTDQLVLYTDGITDANNLQEEMYSEDRLLEFFNEFESNDDPIKPLLNDINIFTGDAKQFDDMTLLYIKIK